MCDQRTKRIVVLYFLAPIVVAYSVDGALLWRAELPDFHLAEPGLAHEGALAWRFNARTKLWSTGVAIIADRSSHVLASVSTRRRGSPDSYVDVHALRISDGAAVYRWRGPEVLAASTGPHVYGYRPLPYPQVVKFRPVNP